MHPMDCLHTASISIDIGISLDKYLAYAKINCQFVLHCVDCKKKTHSGLILWVVDSGVSVHFSEDKSEFTNCNGAATIHG